MILLATISAVLRRISLISSDRVGIGDICISLSPYLVFNNSLIYVTNLTHASFKTWKYLVLIKVRCLPIINLWRKKNLF